MFYSFEDLLIAVRLPVFSRKAKRKLISQKKFYFFDAGVYRAIRPTGPLDSDADGLSDLPLFHRPGKTRHVVAGQSLDVRQGPGSLAVTETGFYQGIGGMHR